MTEKDKNQEKEVQEKNNELEEEDLEKEGKTTEDVNRENQSEVEEENEEKHDNEEDNISQLERDQLEDRVENLEDDLNQIKQERDKLRKKLQRLQADFSNYRKRVEKEKFGLSMEAKIELINDILPVIDNFERALSSKSEEGELREGLKMIYRQLMNTLKQEGLEEISAVGESFDHKYHEAIMQVDDTEEESGKIVEIMQKGYMLNDKVIRPAMVKVAK